MGKEFKNFLKVTYHSFGYAIATIRFLINFISYHIYKKFKKKKIGGYYPLRARFILFNQHTKYTKLVKGYNLELPLGYSYEFKSSIFNFIADEYFHWNQIVKSENKDPEVLCSAARWYWLIYDFEKLENSNTKEIINLSKHWIRSFGYKESSLEWESYNVSERITSFANAMILQGSFFDLLQIVREDDEISTFLRLSIAHLSKHIEYYPSGVSYNHVVNNLKGILTAALLLEDNDLVEKTSNLLFVETDILLIEDGFIREGSSHYQLIITRWYIEMEWLFELAGRKELKTRLADITHRMIKRCMFYFVFNEESLKVTIPLIGDVSPDFDPEWLLDYFLDFYKPLFLFNNRSSYGHKIIETLGYKYLEADSYFDIDYQSNIITRIVSKDWILFLRHQVHDGSYFPNHAHDDYSSFNLFYKGSEVVTDPGRLSYVACQESLSYIRANSHNVVEINGLSVQSSELKRHLLPTWYKVNKASYSLKIEDGKKIITLNSKSLSRIANCKITDYTRRIILTNDQLVIEDLFQGTGLCNVSGQVLLNPKIIISEKMTNSLILKSRNNRLEYEMNDVNSISVEKCPFSSRYQEECSTFKIFYEDQGTLPLKLTMKFKIN